MKASSNANWAVISLHVCTSTSVVCLFDFNAGTGPRYDAQPNTLHTLAHTDHYCLEPIAYSSFLLEKASPLSLYWTCEAALVYTFCCCFNHYNCSTFRILSKDCIGQVGSRLLQTNHPTIKQSAKIDEPPVDFYWLTDLCQVSSSKLWGSCFGWKWCCCCCFVLMGPQNVSITGRVWEVEEKTFTFRWSADLGFSLGFTMHVRGNWAFLKGLI